MIFDGKLGPEQVQQYAEEKEAIYRELYAPDIEEVTGLIKFIDDLQGRNIRTAIATTAPAKNREFALQSLGLEDRFEVILGDEHVVNGKPNPEIFLSTANELSVDPSECIVFEDSPPGVKAGKNAGMVVVGLLTSHASDELSEADYLVNDFTDINLT
jgi:HAD superfamily hydrolase (TIGR01509 family)